jgi:hypothetical protein
MAYMTGGIVRNPAVCDNSLIPMGLASMPTNRS